MGDLFVLGLVLSVLLNAGLAITALIFSVAYGKAKGELAGRRRRGRIAKLKPYPQSGE